MSMVIQSINLAQMGLPQNTITPLPIAWDATMLGVTETPNGPMLSYITTGNAPFGGNQGPRALLVGEYTALPDAQLRWIGSFTPPGFPYPMHLFEVQP